MAYKEYKKLDFPAFEEEILSFWHDQKIFEKSVSNREGAKPFVFYEGPPSANGMPGIHHVMARTIKDLFCRYYTLKGFEVKRKGGWDTHGLPIELQVEKSLGITKDDIGKTISVEAYNDACRRDVMKFKDVWDKLTVRMGYWVDLDHPYITYNNEYIESLWWLLKQLYEKGLLYKGYTIQPFSPAAGTGLSSHELNQPGTYKDVKDHTIVAQFSADKNEFISRFPAIANDSWLLAHDLFFLAWTTTPWTLPSNTALALGAKIKYVLVKTYNAYTHKPMTVILAKDLLGKYFAPELSEIKLSEYKEGDKKTPFEVLAEFSGKELEGIRYEQLMPYALPDNGDAFRTLLGDFVSTEDGTGIVHIAPSFGSDDFRVARQHGIGSLTLVDKQGKFTGAVNDPQFPLAHKYVKEAYLTAEEKAADLREQQEKLKSIIPRLDKYLSIDELIALKLKLENKAFRIEKYEHSYPHCWRTDKPILYYPLESWFIKTTAYKDRLVELNKTINWMPEHTGTGRFGNWLENLVDWNLSRSRYWGTPLPVWRTADGSEELCMSSVEELQKEIEKSIAAGVMDPSFKLKDLHKPYVDEVILVSSKGEHMYREADLIDVWFDSGAMPYAQWHYPFENKEDFLANFPADYIAEGVDQTRGWFFTLHAIAVLLFDSVAFKNVIANGLVLDKKGNKMSKRIGNVVDPFATIAKYGADATRWYLINNSDPWENLKFDIEGVAEAQRKFFGTLYNTYAFFALYANIDGFVPGQHKVPHAERPELDRWIISKLNSLVADVRENMDRYNPTPATRAIEEFVGDHLSNWFVRLSRRRFWRTTVTEMASDKASAYETLFECLEVVAQLMSPFAPFFADWLFRNLHSGDEAASVHLSNLREPDRALINSELEEQMAYAQRISSLVLSIRKKENIKVRQPLQKILIPVVDPKIKEEIVHVKPLILAEVNVKELEFIDAIEKTVKPNFRVLGKKLGPKMKEAAEILAELSALELQKLENEGKIEIKIQGEPVEILKSDLEILSAEIPGYKVATDGKLSVALDTSISESLKNEGIAREIVSKLQELRKKSGLDVIDKIHVSLEAHPYISDAINYYKTYICTEILANSLELEVPDSAFSGLIEVDEHQIKVKLNKAQ